MVGAHIMVYWCTFKIWSSMSRGAQAYPILHPVMAKALLNPLSRTVRSRMPSSEAMETCFVSYVSSEYISSEMTSKSLSIIICLMSSSWARVIIAPVGLLG